MIQTLLFFLPVLIFIPQFVLIPLAPAAGGTSRGVMIGTRAGVGTSAAESALFNPFLNFYFYFFSQ